MCNKGITQFYLPPTHELYLPLLPSHKASPSLGRYQRILLGEQRHIDVRNLSRIFTPCARPRVEPMTSWSQVRHSTNSATMPPHPSFTYVMDWLTALCMQHVSNVTSICIMFWWFCALGLQELSYLHQIRSTFYCECPKIVFNWCRL